MALRWFLGGSQVVPRWVLRWISDGFSGGSQVVLRWFSGG